MYNVVAAAVAINGIVSKWMLSRLSGKHRRRMAYTGSIVDAEYETTSDTMKTTLVFIHGMFQNDKSWKNWVKYFSFKGYNCINEPWPLHHGDPADLRANPPEGLGDLRLRHVVSKYFEIVNAVEDEHVVLIGHSVGGL